MFIGYWPAYGPRVYHASMDHEPTLVRKGYDVRYVCACGWATPWVRDIAAAGAAIVRHASRASEWAA